MSSHQDPCLMEVARTPARLGHSPDVCLSGVRVQESIPGGSGGNCSGWCRAPATPLGRVPFVLDGFLSCFLWAVPSRIHLRAITEHARRGAVAAERFGMHDTRYRR